MNAKGASPRLSLKMLMEVTHINFLSSHKINPIILNFLQIDIKKEVQIAGTDTTAWDVGEDEKT